jgi:arabinan endo-1,5-alpha-L-arabinosidase
MSMRPLHSFLTRLKIQTILLISSSILLASAGAQPGFQPQSLPNGSLRFHDPSTPVLDGKTWHVFSTGNGISTRSSKNLKHWNEGKPVFQQLPDWHREVVPDHKGHLWAPDVIRHGHRYLLYYSVSSWGKNTSAIGLASNSTLDPADPAYGWKDEGIVIRSDTKTPYNAIDPQLFADADGRLWMVFGSFWSGIQLIELDPLTGLRHPERREVRQVAWHEAIEAAALMKHDDFYYLFVNWGRCCRGLDSTYEIRIGRSKSITGPYLDADGVDLATGGGTPFLKSEGEQVGPGHPAFIKETQGWRMFFHYYHGRHRGFPTLGDHPIRWNAAGWPEI